jgi:hypothetical protein
MWSFGSSFFHLVCVSQAYPFIIIMYLSLIGYFLLLSNISLCKYTILCWIGVYGQLCFSHFFAVINLNIIIIPVLLMKKLRLTSLGLMTYSTSHNYSWQGGVYLWSQDWGG